MGVKLFFVFKILSLNVCYKGRRPDIEAAGAATPVQMLSQNSL